MALTGVLINMDIAVECAIVVTIQDGEYTKFKEYNDGLYYFDTKNNKLEDAPAIIPIQSLVSANDNTFPKDNINYPVTDNCVCCSILNTVADFKKNPSLTIKPK